jgi:hypothetical protein
MRGWVDLAETSKSVVFFFVEVTAVVTPSSGPIESGVKHELRDQAGHERGDQCNGEDKDGTRKVKNSPMRRCVELLCPPRIRFQKASSQYRMKVTTANAVVRRSAD